MEKKYLRVSFENGLYFRVYHQRTPAVMRLIVIISYRGAGEAPEKTLSLSFAERK
jgi:hypothetical protein